MEGARSGLVGFVARGGGWGREREGERDKQFMRPRVKHTQCLRERRGACRLPEAGGEIKTGGGHREIVGGCAERAEGCSAREGEHLLGTLVSSHESATFRERAGHFCGRVARLATRQGLLYFSSGVKVVPRARENTCLGICILGFRDEGLGIKFRDQGLG